VCVALSKLDFRLTHQFCALNMDSITHVFFVRFEVLMVASMKMAAFWNVGLFPRDNRALHPRKLSSSYIHLQRSTF
jgi:hypothetical protein